MDRRRNKVLPIKREGEMELKYRDSKCLVCGHVQPIQTNHIGTCFAFCYNCSWKSFGFDHDNTMNYGGRAYRRFQVQDVETYK